MTTLFRGTLTTYISGQFKSFFQSVIDELNYNTPWPQGKTALFEVLKNTFLNKLPVAAGNMEGFAKSFLNV